MPGQTPARVRVVLCAQLKVTLGHSTVLTVHHVAWDGSSFPNFQNVHLHVHLSMSN